MRIPRSNQYRAHPVSQYCAPPRTMSRRLGPLSASILTFTRRAAIVVLITLASANIGPDVHADEPAKFVGRQVCSGCHASEAERWKGSHHALAMQKATEATVLGDFADAQLEHFGVISIFSHSGDKFIVRTDGPDGTTHEYEIAYTFGVYPLQQYLIAFRAGATGHSASPGTAGKNKMAASAGSTSTPIRNSNPATGYTGPAATRPGTISAPIATRPI